MDLKLERGVGMSLYGHTYININSLKRWVNSLSVDEIQSVAITFIKSYVGVCLEGAIIVLACIIFSQFAGSSPVVDSEVSAISMLWSYIGELIFNMLILVGTVKMSDRIVKEMMGL